MQIHLVTLSADLSRMWPGTGLGRGENAAGCISILAVAGGSLFSVAAADSGAIAPLLGLLKDGSPRAQEAAAEALGRYNLEITLANMK